MSSRASAPLSPAQYRAIEHINKKAVSLQDESAALARAAFERSGVALDLDLVALARKLLDSSTITLNFHPDRLLPGALGTSVIDGILENGVYRSQFLTGTTSASRTAFLGGERDTWEAELFGGAYHDSPETRANFTERPKYGALNVMHFVDGASPRFGSCYFQLKPHMNERATFTFGDSYLKPKVVGAQSCFEAVLAAWIDAIDSLPFDQRWGWGLKDLQELVSHLIESGKELVPRMGRSLDHYIEAQLHGEIDLHYDVQALVADPSFRGTETGLKLEQTSLTYGFKLKWHQGFELAPSEVNSDFRGPLIPPLALRIDKEFGDSRGIIDAEILGKAARNLSTHPDNWSEFSSEHEAFQSIKQLWHHLVMFGRPSSR